MCPAEEDISRKFVQKQLRPPLLRTLSLLDTSVPDHKTSVMPMYRILQTSRLTQTGTIPLRRIGPRDVTEVHSQRPERIWTLRTKAYIWLHALPLDLYGPSVTGSWCPFMRSCLHRQAFRSPESLEVAGGGTHPGDLYFPLSHFFVRQG